MGEKKKKENKSTKTPLCSGPDQDKFKFNRTTMFPPKDKSESVFQYQVFDQPFQYQNVERISFRPANHLIPPPDRIRWSPRYTDDSLLQPADGAEEAEEPAEEPDGREVHSLDDSVDQAVDTVQAEMLQVIDDGGSQVAASEQGDEPAAIDQDVVFRDQDEPPESAIDEDGHTDPVIMAEPKVIADDDDDAISHHDMETGLEMSLENDSRPEPGIAPDSAQLEPALITVDGDLTPETDTILHNELPASNEPEPAEPPVQTSPKKAHVAFAKDTAPSAKKSKKQSSKKKTPAKRSKGKKVGVLVGNFEEQKRDNVPVEVVMESTPETDRAGENVITVDSEVGHEGEMVSEVLDAPAKDESDNATEKPVDTNQSLAEPSPTDPELAPESAAGQTNEGVDLNVAAAVAEPVLVSNEMDVSNDVDSEVADPKGDLDDVDDPNTADDVKASSPDHVKDVEVGGADDTSQREPDIVEEEANSGHVVEETEPLRPVDPSADPVTQDTSRETVANEPTESGEGLDHGTDQVLALTNQDRDGDGAITAGPDGDIILQAEDVVPTEIAAAEDNAGAADPIIEDASIGVEAVDMAATATEHAPPAGQAGTDVENDAAPDAGSSATTTTEITPDAHEPVEASPENVLKECDTNPPVEATASPEVISTEDAGDVPPPSNVDVPEVEAIAQDEGGGDVTGRDEHVEVVADPNSNTSANGNVPAESAPEQDQADDKAVLNDPSTETTVTAVETVPSTDTAVLAESAGEASAASARSKSNRNHKEVAHRSGRHENDELNGHRTRLTRHKGEKGPFVNAYSRAIDKAKLEAERRHESEEYKAKKRDKEQRRARPREERRQKNHTERERGKVREEETKERERRNEARGPNETNSGELPAAATGDANNSNRHSTETRPGKQRRPSLVGSVHSGASGSWKEGIAARPGLLTRMMTAASLPIVPGGGNSGRRRESFSGKILFVRVKDDDDDGSGATEHARAGAHDEVSASSSSRRRHRRRAVEGGDHASAAEPVKTDEASSTNAGARLEAEGLAPTEVEAATEDVGAVASAAVKEDAEEVNHEAADSAPNPEDGASAPSEGAAKGQDEDSAEAPRPRHDDEQVILQESPSQTALGLVGGGGGDDDGGLKIRSETASKEKLPRKKKRHSGDRKKEEGEGEGEEGKKTQGGGSAERNRIRGETREHSGRSHHHHHSRHDDVPPIVKLGRAVRNVLVR